MENRAFFAAAFVAFGIIVGAIVFGVPSSAPHKEAKTAEVDQTKAAADSKSGSVSPEERTADYTLWLAILTGALVAVTGSQMYFLTRADNTARMAAKAAERAADALPLAERAFVYAVITKPGFRALHSFNQAPGLAYSEFTISFPNYGRTPAIITRLEYVFSIAASGSIADPIDPSVIGGREIPPGIISIKGAPYEESPNLFNYFGVDKPEIRKSSGWIVGFIRYDDVFGQHHITGFTQVYDAIGERWVSRGDARYNYARTEKEGDIPFPSSTG